MTRSDVLSAGISRAQRNNRLPHRLAASPRRLELKIKRGRFYQGSTRSLENASGSAEDGFSSVFSWPKMINLHEDTERKKKTDKRPTEIISCCAIEQPRTQWNDRLSPKTRHCETMTINVDKNRYSKSTDRNSRPVHGRRRGFLSYLADDLRLYGVNVCESD